MTITDWIRPWYPGEVAGGLFVGHIDPECEALLRVRADVIEGAGWLDPTVEPVCGMCVGGSR